MKTAYSYRRWSTASQSDRDSGIRQSNSAKRWMDDFGTSLGYILSEAKFTDAGKSGYKGKHIAKDESGQAKGDLMRFIQSVEEGTISRDSILLIDEISRFSRLPLSIAVPLFMDVLNSGIGLVFTSSFDKRIITAQLINSDGYLLPSLVSDNYLLICSSNESAFLLIRFHFFLVCVIPHLSVKISAWFLSHFQHFTRGLMPWQEDSHRNQIKISHFIALIFLLNRNKVHLATL